MKSRKAWTVAGALTAIGSVLAFGIAQGWWAFAWETTAHAASTYETIEHARETYETKADAKEHAAAEDVARIRMQLQLGAIEREHDQDREEIRRLADDTRRTSRDVVKLLVKFGIQPTEE